MLRRPFTWVLIGGIVVVLVVFTRDTRAPVGRASGDAASEKPLRVVVEEPDGALVPPDRPDAPAAIKPVPFDPSAADEALGDELIEPDYGPLLERAEGHLELSLKDASGAALSQRPIGGGRFRLWRTTGAYAHLIPASVDWRAGSAQLRLNSALEPGIYDIEASIGSYGVARQRVILLRGETRRSRLTFPGRARVVTLRFVDPEGAPVPFLKHPPEFVHQRSVGLGRGRPGAPTVLRDPPSPFNSVEVWDESSSSSASYGSRVSRGSRYRTEEGSYRVLVVAGVGGEIIVDLGAPFFRSSQVVLRGDFAGPEWNDYLVRVSPSKEYGALMARCKDANPGDAGARSLLRRGALGAPGPSAARQRRDPFDLDRLRRQDQRFVIDVLSQQRGVYPLLFPTSAQAPVAISTVESSPGRWVRELRTGREYGVVLSDGALYRGESHAVPEEGGRIHHLRVEDRGEACVLEVESSPTLAAWAKKASFCLSFPHAESAEPWWAEPELRAALREGTRHHYDSYLSSRQRAALKRGATLHLAYGPSALFQDGSDHPRTYGHNGKLFQIVLNREERKSLSRGRLEVNLARRISGSRRGPLLAFRCVGDAEEGIPWVEASVVPLRSDVLARDLQATSQLLTKEQKRPDPQRVLYGRNGGEVEEEFPIEEEPEERAAPPRTPMDSKKLESLFGSELGRIYGIAGLRRLQVQGAWYDTHRKARSGMEGYVLATNLGLKVGRRYALYLWSRSRDDLHPDRRVVFEATPGLCDLGVIRLPSH